MEAKSGSLVGRPRACLYSSVCRPPGLRARRSYYYYYLCLSVERGRILSGGAKMQTCLPLTYRTVRGRAFDHPPDLFPP